jgi:hypothetical protein
MYSCRVHVFVADSWSMELHREIDAAMTPSDAIDAVISANTHRYRRTCAHCGKPDGDADRLKPVIMSHVSDGGAIMKTITSVVAAVAFSCAGAHTCRFGTVTVVRKQFLACRKEIHAAAAAASKSLAADRTCAKCRRAQTCHAFAVCGRCKIARYCAATCQKSDWPQHRLICIPPSPMDEPELPSPTRYACHVHLIASATEKVLLCHDVDQCVSSRDAILSMLLIASKLQPAFFVCGGCKHGSRSDADSLVPLLVAHTIKDYPDSQDLITVVACVAHHCNNNPACTAATGAILNATFAQIRAEVSDAVPILSPSLRLFRKCRACEKSEADMPPQSKKFQVCGRCRGPYYCSAECAKNAWKSHRPYCSATTNNE